MKFTTPLIILLCFGWFWSELRNKTKDDYIQTILEENRSLQLKYDDAIWKATAYDSANAKTQRAYDKMVQTIENTNKKRK